MSKIPNKTQIDGINRHPFVLERIGDIVAIGVPDSPDAVTIDKQLYHYTMTVDEAQELIDQLKDAVRPDHPNA